MGWRGRRWPSRARRWNASAAGTGSCSGEGRALKKLAVGNNCFTYGVELDEGRANIAQKELHRVGFGSFFHSRISNEAFHAVLLNPPYLSVLTEGGGRARDEKRFLIETVPHMMFGGLLIYIIPYYRLTPDICRILCDNFSDITVHRFTDDEFGKFSQIVVMGLRIKRINGSEQVDALAELAFRKNDIPCVTEIEEARYALPAKPKKVEIFKGSVFNKAELARQLRESKSLDSLFSAKALTQDVRQPPLPFTFSQLGLIGGSGLINGLIECDCPHIIKGRIVKEKRVRTEENANSKGDLMSTTQTETISNKLIFNLLTPKGFMSLTDYGNGGSVVDSDDDPREDTTRLGYSNSAGKANSSNVQFSLGREVITSGARAVLTDDEIDSALRRHEACDWGTVSKDDWKSNDNAIKNGERVLSSYLNSGGEPFWIITEWDRSATTVLLPDEY